MNTNFNRSVCEWAYMVSVCMALPECQSRDRECVRTRVNWGWVWEPVVLRGRLGSCYRRIRLYCNPNFTLLFFCLNTHLLKYTHTLSQTHSLKWAGLRVFVMADSLVRWSRMLNRVIFSQTPWILFIFFLLISVCLGFFFSNSKLQKLWPQIACSYKVSACSSKFKIFIVPSGANKQLGWAKCACKKIWI